MSNLEKVSDLILLNFAWDCPDCNAIWGVCASCKADTDDAARALADAGLLAPELPEPNDHSVFAPAGRGWLLNDENGPVVWTAPGGTVMVQRVEPGDLTPDDARDLAYALLAAANYAEGTAP